MVVANEKPTGTSYTTMVALVILGFIFVPAVLIISRPLGYISLSAALVCSAICAALAGFEWKKSSQLTISSIAYQRAETK